MVTYLDCFPDELPLKYERNVVHDRCHEDAEGGPSDPAERPQVGLERMAHGQVPVACKEDHGPDGSRVRCRRQRPHEDVGPKILAALHRLSTPHGSIAAGSYVVLVRKVRYHRIVNGVIITVVKVQITR